MSSLADRSLATLKGLKSLITPQPVANPIPVHDPVMIQQDGNFYIFCTGPGITVFSSPDMKNWIRQAPVFSPAPQWAVQLIPGFKGHIWAPDISFHNGEYYLYYSVSAFGKNTSAIGLATNKTLDPKSPEFKWTDHGKVIQSVPGRDMWNAIDPNLVIDESQTPWLTFGSFWNGIKMVKLNKTMDGVAEPERWFTLASRNRSFQLADTLAGDAAIEAPFIYRHGNYYYLFVSFDYCCRGEKSTYKIMVGRSEHINGPYADMSGKSMAQGGGTLVLEGNADWHGAGPNAVVKVGEDDIMLFHGYDAHDRGKSKLITRKLLWTNDWPSASPD